MWYDDDAFWKAYLPMLEARSNAERVAEEVDGIVERLALASGASVVDLGCGIGRHCLEPAP